MEPYTSKRRKELEIYEEYWKITAAWTDIFGSSFNDCLGLIVVFIDEHKVQLSLMTKDRFKSSGIYDELQDKIIRVMDFKGNDAGTSARKAINTFVKLGFVEPYLRSYHELCRKFLSEHDKEEKRIIFSKIFYQNSSLCSSVTEDNRGPSHIKFFLTTLDRNKRLNADDIKALMITDITRYPEGYLTKSQLEQKRRLVEANGFEERKYNQISHLKSFLKNFVDIKYVSDNDCFYFADDPDVVNKDEIENLTRDPIRYRIFRDELKAESRRLFNGVVCFVEKRPYKGLVASHIKPSHICIKEGVEDEAYDVNNGLLLSKNIDQYFNDFDITFDEDGYIVIGKRVHPAIAELFRGKHLDGNILNDERQKYLDYHRAAFEKRNYRS